MSCGVLQCVAACCSVLQCVAVCMLPHPREAHQKYQTAIQSPQRTHPHPPPTASPPHPAAGRSENKKISRFSCGTRLFFSKTTGETTRAWVTGRVPPDFLESHTTNKKKHKRTNPTKHKTRSGGVTVNLIRPTLTVNRKQGSKLNFFRKEDSKLDV